MKGQNTLFKVELPNMRELKNLLGWRTQKRLIVLESDDWGSIRMPGPEVYNKFRERGYALAESEYNRLDSLESDSDLESLFTVLRKYSDCTGRHPVFTANVVVANPDFEKIRNSGFSEYHYETVTETFKKQEGKSGAFGMWMQGRKERLFHPQFHAREHLNIKRWMKALNSGNISVRFSFDLGTTFSGEGDYSFMEVLDTDRKDETDALAEIISDGYRIFTNLTGYSSKSFIPPCYVWPAETEKTLSELGIKYIQGIPYQFIPRGGFGNYKKKFHYLGQRNRYGQVYLIRNCFFEPALSPAKNTVVNDCLKRIEQAFRWGKPAIISSHRINYIGSLSEANRRENLILLDALLSEISKRWSDAEFITSDELGDIITNQE